MPAQTKTVLRYEVPIDDQPHTFRLTHSPHAVATKTIGPTHRVEFWVEHEDRPDVTAVRRTFQVFGTGQPIPSTARIVGTTERLDGLVWHLYEIVPEHSEKPTASDGPKCGHVVGPVWKDGGESWACDKPAGHDLTEGHAAWDADGKGGSWWVHEACRPEVQP